MNRLILALMVITLILLGWAQYDTIQTQRHHTEMLLQDNQDLTRIKMQLLKKTDEKEFDLMDVPWYYRNTQRTLVQI